MNFDAPKSVVAQCRRERSNTPLQALNLLNDPVFLESAMALAYRAIAEAPDTNSRPNAMFEYTPEPGRHLARDGTNSGTSIERFREVV